ncbi:RteC domain-containing protein [Dysgonomonas sp. GY75]|uniref:RteC domain-containing protein n=1 Tax=Dysgonomonas sp. GY75 TaxID=2780419 RepID=UPI0018832839|nr:RteC domain-containing protein [Dysgonomonas sp. GY75]MBF0651513.1 RteC domain-containing protein [Dysgonomonas sp. GY75]
MENYISSLKDKVFQNIQEVEKMECSVLHKSKLIVPRLESAFEELKSFVSNYSFKDEDEEIFFFKEMKPQLFSQLIYYNEVYNIEIRMPAGSIGSRKEYLERIQNQIKFFFDMNSEFYQYYRSGSTYLDQIYFLRRKPCIQLQLDSSYFERDCCFSTCYGLKMTQILTNERLLSYLNVKLAKLQQEGMEIGSYTDFHPDLKWTEKKTALGEIIYGIDSLRSVCFGNVNIKVLAKELGDLFNVDMSNIFQIYGDIRKRKIDRTEYLNRMIDALRRRMDEDDNK